MNQSTDEQFKQDVAKILEEADRRYYYERVKRSLEGLEAFKKRIKEKRTNSKEEISRGN